ncbi:VIT family-domain-containing protein [Amylocarpus encephaloides]|uniref:VIT family-domain-containing protein n=1 Tax=Amylocarpus encephaloides TaxID=45428 RepID=A0A9P7YLA7_9HELO|nr:VIT family-domain-containing protein [Amylocarpus encephaloides]
MSLVGLKNFFFHRTVIPISRDKGPNQPLLPSDHRPKYDAALGERTSFGVENHDIESQQTVGSNGSKRGFRIDPRTISDATIGLSDGLTVPFALTAGLSALGNTKVVVFGGLAELIAGAISMGLGGYLGAKSEAQSYKTLKEETEELINSNPDLVVQGVTEVFEPYDLPKHTLADITDHLANSDKLVDFVMKFEHCAEEPASTRALKSASTIALAYFLGGFLPLFPYFFVDEVYQGLYVSIGLMVLALFAFGYVKTCVVVGWNGGRKIRAGCFGGVQMVVVGGAAAGAAMGLVQLFSQDSGV